MKSQKQVSPKFKVGDRVRYLGGKWDNLIRVGDTGTVVEPRQKYDMFLVCWDNPRVSYDGHWNAYSSELELDIKYINENKLRNLLK